MNMRLNFTLRHNFIHKSKFLQLVLFVRRDGPRAIGSLFRMYHPTNQGFFPLLVMRVEQSLSIEEKAAFASQKTLKDRLSYVNNLTRLNGDDPTMNIFRLLLIQWILITQGSQTRGPRPACGPPNEFFRLASTLKMPKSKIFIKFSLF
jgi:hypothetical protein